MNHPPISLINRRKFLIASGVTGAAGLVAGSGAVSWDYLTRRAAADPRPSGNKILVIVTLYGGNDGLNTVIPYADPAYHDARTELAYSGEQVIALDNSLGLNPALTGLHSLWQQNKLAIVRGVDYPNPDFSHFRSMDIWQTASPQAPVNTGWIGRWLDASGDDPIRAVNIGSVLPPLAVGAHSTAAALPVGRHPLVSSDFSAALTGLSKPDRSDTASRALVAGSYGAERKVAATFARVLDPAVSSSAPASTGAPVSATAARPSSELASQLDVISRCISASVPTTVYSADLGGFDTHADEKGTQQAILKILDTAISAFFTSLHADPHGPDVVLLAYSEFGRRVAANASQGTDHGSAGPVFVMGNGVRGGFYGAEPSLTDLTDGNLKPSVDFRSVYSELIRRVLDADPARVLGGSHPELGLLI